MIYRMLAEPYYYGEFEYPVGSGKFYKGSHEPIITKDLFLKVREKLTVAPKRHPGTIEFAFARLMYCGSCGSGISAEEKFKHQKNGAIHRYVYYHCSYGRDRDCKEPAIREENLISQMIALIDQVNIDKLKTTEKIKKEMERFQKFSYIAGNGNENISKNPKNIDLRNYAKYILLEGAKQEKRDLLECLNSKIYLKDRNIYLE